jgi:hypothetical protein
MREGRERAQGRFIEPLAKLTFMGLFRFFGGWFFGLFVAQQRLGALVRASRTGSSSLFRGWRRLVFMEHECCGH